MKLITKAWLQKTARKFIEHSAENVISQSIACSKAVVGLKLFNAPLMGFASADDPCFASLKQPSVIGQHVLLPRDWLPSAKTVISFFLPFSEAVRQGNSRDMAWPADAWLHGRIEGQILLNHLSQHLNDQLINAGFDSLVPSLDDRFWSSSGDQKQYKAYSSNWSERHVAYICGLGTFGLSKGLITPKGVAGRFGSIITELSLPADQRISSATLDFCLQCGQCIQNCPVGAISFERGKDHEICSRFLNQIKEACIPRYGCGKCQVNVPCESRMPGDSWDMP